VKKVAPARKRVNCLRGRGEVKSRLRRVGGVSAGIFLGVWVGREGEDVVVGGFSYGWDGGQIGRG